jgi:hypothetical protein
MTDFEIEISLVLTQLVSIYYDAAFIAVINEF